MNIANSPPSQVCVQAISDFAHHMKLDAQLLLGGAVFVHQQLSFRLQHHGALDPDAVVLQLDMGECPPEHEAAAFRRLLEHHSLLPAARCGYYAVAPGTRRIVFCQRIALDAQAAHTSIAAAVQTLATGVEQTMKHVRKALQDLDVQVLQ